MSVPSATFSSFALKLHSRERWAFGCFIVLWSCLLCLLYVQGNDFSIYWNFDEPSKAAQFLSEKWNFNHPQLLLTATRIALIFSVADPVAHDIVVAGRICSALFAAGSVLLLSILTYRIHSLMAGIITAFFVGTGSLLFGLAHYMKEDTALLFGLSAFFLGLSLFESHKSSLSGILVLGIGAGAAAAGKFVGLSAVAIAITVLVREVICGRSTLTRIAMFAAGAAGVFVLADLPMLFQFDRFLEGFLWGVHHVTSHHFSVVSPVWDPIFLKDITMLCAPPALLVFGYIVLQIVRGERFSLSMNWLAIFPIIYLGIIQLSAVKLDRYVLPVVVFIQVVASCGLSEFLLSHSRALKASAALGVVACMCWNLWQLNEANAALTDSNRLYLAQWIRLNMPAGAQIAEETIVGLSQSDPSAPKLSAAIRTEDNAAEFGSIEELTSNGVSYVVISDHYYKLFFNPIYRIAGYAGAEKKIAARRRFYSELFSKGVLLFEAAARGPPGTEFSPKLELYRVGP
jgi:hypothetical protein